ncbi:MAG: thioesterase family protein [Solirubrobacterales bacterium]
MSAFASDTAASRIAPGRYAVELSDRWWVGRGPNGGYVAALMLRAMSQESESAAVATAGAGLPQPPRSLTVHFLNTPSVGVAEIEVTIERQGRSTMFLSARLIQEGEVQGKAMAVFSADRQGPSFVHTEMPEVKLPEEGEEFDTSLAPVPVFARYRAIPVLGGAPMSGGDRAETAGWLKLADEESMSPELAAAMLDVWYPAPFVAITEPAVAPTLEYTVHFPRALPIEGSGPSDWVLARLKADEAVEGHFTEDGELWTTGGVLLARCRQVALLKSVG